MTWGQRHFDTARRFQLLVERKGKITYRCVLSDLPDFMHEVAMGIHRSIPPQAKRSFLLC